MYSPDANHGVNVNMNAEVSESHVDPNSLTDDGMTGDHPYIR